MPEGYDYEGSGSRKMGKKKMKYGENYSQGKGKLKAKAMKKGSMTYTTGDTYGVDMAAGKGKKKMSHNPGSHY